MTVCTCTGETINQADRCKQCDGKKVVEENKILSVNVDRGMRNEQKIVLRGEGDQAVSTMYHVIHCV